MKIFRRLLFALTALLLLAFLSLWIYLRQTAPTYQGKLDKVGLQAEVEVLFDDYGIPHIYAQNGPDAYKALGYVHAQDRLFQMEMIRRLAAGQLAEILGPELVEVDRFFRTLGFRQKAKEQVALFFKQTDDGWQQLAQSYLDGINAFIEHGPTPPEFSIIGIPKRPFKPEDIYATIYYMSLGFAQGTNSDPFFTQIKDKFGPAYSSYWDNHWPADSSQNSATPTRAEEALFGNIIRQTETAGTPLWTGSNGWLLSPSRTSSGRAILANDTHIKFSQPSVWYEAYMEYPGFSFYGYYLAGVPFPIIGHNQQLAWGLTIYPIDNLDLYLEHPQRDNPQFIFQARDSSWIPLQKREETISIKGEKDSTLLVYSSPRGPIINQVVPELQDAKQPVSLWWSLLQLDSHVLEALYHMQRARDLESFQSHLPGIDIIGLNVLYADADNHIAWWGCGKIPKRAPHLNPFFLLDAGNVQHLPTGEYLPFELNPHSIDPPEGVIVSANNRPVEGPAQHYPGYYLPQDRFLRITELLKQKEKWNLDELKAIQADVYSLSDHHLAGLLAKELENHCPEQKDYIHLLKNWDGQYTRQAAAPTLYNKLLFHLLRLTLTDEIGEEDFLKILDWYAFKDGIPKLLQDPSAPWWDNINTADIAETRDMLLCQALNQSIEELNAQLGTEPDSWKWERVHTLTHQHLLGQQKPLDKFFNVGPFPVEGGNAVPLKMEYALNPQGLYPAKTGPALRILIDFAQPDQSLSINPTGQSGHFMSPHYSDQAEIYVNKQYRRQISSRKELQKAKKLLLQ